MKTESIQPGQTYESLYMDGAIADTFYVTRINEGTAHLKSLSTSKPVRIELTKMVIDMQHGQLKLKQ
ncbi:hypothetical protein KDU71_02455 [Carboxylicivirga sediminis]|uniref:Uncharacterized protein n=1 Tax=Carboxylicivirga sediminis TaxID=2006564 RepID=A0A941ITP6_9BACT|nr:hypothetical protein [Carboxylicivirga sediminis]MBR8534406.1 hypothetical protein [Carboxylicivirga sediminis]